MSRCYTHVLILAICLASSGCGGEPPAVTPSLLPSVPSGASSQVAKSVQSYVTGLQTHDANAISALMAPGVGAPKPQLKYRSLASARNCKVSTVDAVANGAKLVAHVSYDSNGSRYLTNFTFKDIGGKWLIDGIVPPTKTAPPKAFGVGAKKKGK